jgi:hypothetical protein
VVIVVITGTQDANPCRPRNAPAAEPTTASSPSASAARRNHCKGQGDAPGPVDPLPQGTNPLQNLDNLAC